MPATYRYELAKTGRAKCQVKHEENEKTIEKGELRFGSLVTISEHTSWKWKHWGCVTPAQIANILDQIGGLDGLDVEKDLDILDGYDELSHEAQEKVKYALVNGHVHNDDWKGDPELNVPGAKGLHKKSPRKKKAKKEDKDESNDPEASPVPKTKKRKSKKQVQDDEDDEPPKKKAASKKRKADVVEDDDEDEEPKRKRGSKKATSPVKDEEEEEDDDDATNELPKESKQAGKKRGRKGPTDYPAVGIQVDGADDGETQKKPKAGRGRGKKAVKEESPIDEPAKPTRSRAKKVKEEPVAHVDIDEHTSSTDEAPATKPTRGRAKLKRKAK